VHVASAAYHRPAMRGAAAASQTRAGLPSTFGMRGRRKAVIRGLRVLKPSFLIDAGAAGATKNIRPTRPLSSNKISISIDAGKASVP
jgi:hypothetical protein